MENILARIPGEYLAPDHYCLPNPATTTEKTATAVANVPHIGQVRIVYQRMYSQRGKFGNHFWTPCSAEALMPQRPRPG